MTVHFEDFPKILGRIIFEASDFITQVLLNTYYSIDKAKLIVVGGCKNTEQNRQAVDNPRARCFRHSFELNFLEFFTSIYIYENITSHMLCTELRYMLYNP